jgi:primosomal protein N' (replication factor Y)
VIAQVIVEVAHAQVDRVFDYRIPNYLDLSVGDRVQVPFGPRRIEGYVVGLAEASDLPDARLKAVLGRLDERPIIPEALVNLARWMQTHCHCLLVEALRLMLPYGLRGGRVGFKQQKWVAPTGAPWREVLPARAVKQRQVMALLTEPMPLAELERQLPGAREAVKALAQKELVVLQDRRAERDPFAGPAQVQPPFAPNEQQQAAIDALRAALDSGDKAGFLLQGVTGSGKTEVYLQAIDHCLAQGRSAIVLVPEISLTPQMVGRFRRRFGDRVAVLHSALSDGERHDQWYRARKGQVQVVVGARSALFAPVQRLGLVVIDEEHEGSYRSESAPRYDARQVAQARCALEGAVLVLGSATPSVEMRYRAGLGRIAPLLLTSRYGQAQMPQVQVVDMRAELKGGNRSIFSAALSGALEQTLARGEQVILFLNRRGHSSFLSCRSCGEPVKCPQCDVSLTYHREGYLKCHYCGYQQPLPQVCPHCASAFIKLFGTGTQKVEQAVQERFPGVGVVRMDMDTTRGKDAHRTLLERFGSGGAQVLVGTQMIAKGLDFPGVTLVGVLAADLSLNLPDYRASERTFQLVTQVVGRAGRADKPGRAVVQTYLPDHYSIRCAAEQDYEGFYRMEIEARRKGEYPPFVTMVRLLAVHEDPDKAQEAIAGVLQAARGMLPGEDLLQCAATTAPIGRIQGKSRFQALLKLASTPRVNGEIDALAQLCRRAGAPVYLDINPHNML